MDTNTAGEVQQALRPLASLISKSQKAQQKVAPGTWQHAMLQQHLDALHAAYALITGDDQPASCTAYDRLPEAIDAFVAMIEKTEKAQIAFSPGTPQHTLLQNRLDALRIGMQRLHVELERIDQHG